MFIIFLKFTEQKAEAATYMPAHNEWLQKGFEAGAFVFAGTLEPKSGGCLISLCSSKNELSDILSKDPFVEKGIVIPEIIEVSPSKLDPKLAFLQS